ncbi:hypothetical protein PENANT_c068G10526 [Penicillium antarcticum]|uniref:Uncharacterized protein n=1 Tax=Penicillium antarcticum TaxID=416450 RepID=A0A1V6PPY5_9EURO|nr:hypothetical protein PENANT_c068G10526 [Penicillium antarcticum]
MTLVCFLSEPPKLHQDLRKYLRYNTVMESGSL